MTEIWTALERRAAQRPADPVVTYVGADGQRTELSARTLANNVAKAANALRDEALHDPGARIALHLPWHWQRPVWALAAWAVDLTVEPFGDPIDCAQVITAPEFATALAGEGAAEVWVVSMHPFGLPNASVPDGCLDAATIARAQPDAFTPFGRSHHVALDGLSQVDLLDAAREIVVPPRFLAAGEHGWLLPTLVPLVHGASIVMCAADVDVAAISREEAAESLA